MFTNLSSQVMSETSNSVSDHVVPLEHGTHDTARVLNDVAGRAMEAHFPRAWRLTDPRSHITGRFSAELWYTSPTNTMFDFECDGVDDFTTRNFGNGEKQTKDDSDMIHHVAPREVVNSISVSACERKLDYLLRVVIS